MPLHPTEAALLEDLARAKKDWVEIAGSAIDQGGEPGWSDHPDRWMRLRKVVCEAGLTDDFKIAVGEVLSGAIHSILVTLDGGSQLAETTLLRVVDDDGHEFAKYLHEYWPFFDETEA